MTLNDQDLLFLSEMLPQCTIRDTVFAERLEQAINKRMIVIEERLMCATAKLDAMTRAKMRVNDVTWYGGKRD